MKWIIASIVAAVAMFVVLDTVTGADVVRCYKCNSYFQADCGDWFNNRTFNLEACPEGVTMCRKIVQEVYYNDEWNVRYIRQCATQGEIGGDEGRRCKERTGTYQVKMRYCHCDNQDGCNGAAHTKVSMIAVLLPVLSTLATIVLRYL